MIIHSQMKNILGKSCQCKRLINVYGYGNGHKNDKNHMKICYVFKASTYPDLVDSYYSKHRKYSEEACTMNDRNGNTSEHGRTLQTL